MVYDVDTVSLMTNPGVLCNACDQPATLVRQWRTPAMRCSAFNYYCDDHACRIGYVCTCGALLTDQFEVITGTCPDCSAADLER